MAMFWGQACALCGVQMTRSDRLFATSYAPFPDSDLSRYSDAVMHWDCYAGWEHRARFARTYFEARRRWVVNSSDRWGVARSDGRVLVRANPDRHVRQVDVLLAETGSGFRVPLADWEGWLGSAWLGVCRHAVEREALAAVLPLLRAELPTAAAVVAAAGMELTPSPG